MRVTEVLVPAVGLGAGVAWVRDARTGRELRVAAPTVRLVGVRVFVVATSHGVEDGLHRVTLPDGTPAWVRATPCDPPTPAGAAA